MSSRVRMSEFRFEPRHRFRDVIGIGLAQAPRMMSGTLIPDFQAAAMGDHRCPHVLARQAFAYLPGFVEYRNRTIGLDLTNEMDTSSSDGQGLRHVGHLIGRQAPFGFAALRLLGGHIGQEGRRVGRHIPAHKGWAGTAYSAERRKPAALPEGMPPQAVQLFDLAIAFGFGDWQKDKFDAEVQTQPDELPEDAWGFVAATEGGVVVELQKVRDSQGFPGVPAMSDDGGAAFVGGDGLGARPRAQ